MSRDSLKAYFGLQQTHRQLHKVLKTIEEDCTTEEILKRARTTRQTLDEAIARLEKMDNDP